MHLRLLRGLLGASVVCVCSLFISCATTAPSEVMQESGWYYGFGRGATQTEASAQAKQALIGNALTESARREGHRGRIEVTAEAAAAFKLPSLKPIAQEKKDGSVTVVYRFKAADWDKYEGAREAALRTEIAGRLAALRDGTGDGTGAALSGRMKEAAGLLDRLGREGLYDVLGETGTGVPLLSTAVETYCRGAAEGLVITASPAGGFVGKDTVFTAQVLTGDGKPASSVPLRAEWSTADGSPAPVFLSTGADGVIALSCPAGAGGDGRAVRLTITTDFSKAAPGSPALKDLDASTRVVARYHYFQDAEKFFSTQVLVPGGQFTAGAVKADTRASRKEAPRPAETKDLYVDVCPVTNALYGMFLEDTGSEKLPEYWDNPAYNAPDQPVIGVSLEDANRFALWLSAQLGEVRRLPTEDEWEKAARGGGEGIYPWGDQVPTDGIRANYSGNGRFPATSPVGGFPEGANAYGLYDMAGNVWQWTSTPNAGGVIVKGGSWMDGPTDLRVSNRRELNPAKGYVDVGFRLVREVTK